MGIKVSLHNSLILADFGLIKLNEFRLLLYLIAKINSVKCKKLETFTIRISEIQEQETLPKTFKIISRLIKTFECLSRINIRITGEQDKIIPIFESLEIDRLEREIILSFSKELEQYLINLEKGNFTTFKLNNLNSLNSAQSIKLYMVLLSALRQNKKLYRVKMKNILMYIGSNAHANSYIYNLLKEVTAKTNINCLIEKRHLDGGRLKELTFNLAFKQSKQDNTQIKQTQTQYKQAQSIETTTKKYYNPKKYGYNNKEDSNTKNNESALDRELRALKIIEDMERDKRETQIREMRKDIVIIDDVDDEDYFKNKKMHDNLNNAQSIQAQTIETKQDIKKEDNSPMLDSRINEPDEQYNKDYEEYFKGLEEMAQNEDNEDKRLTPYEHAKQKKDAMNVLEKIKQYRPKTTEVKTIETKPKENQSQSIAQSYKNKEHYTQDDHYFMRKVEELRRKNLGIGFY